MTRRPNWMDLERMVADARMLRHALGEGLDANLRGAGGETLLHVAACNESPECLRLLLEHGADPGAVDLSGETPLHHGVHRAANLRLLLEAGACPDVASESGFTPLHLACAYGRLASVRQLVAEGADLHRVDADGRGCAYQALISGDRELIAFLRRCGVDFEAPDAAGSRPAEKVLGLGHVRGIGTASVEGLLPVGKAWPFACEADDPDLMIALSSRR